MTVLEITLIIILYIIGLIITAIKMKGLNDDFLYAIGSMLWPIIWVIRIIEAILVQDWKW